MLRRTIVNDILYIRYQMCALPFRQTA